MKTSCAFFAAFGARRPDAASAAAARRTRPNARASTRSRARRAQQFAEPRASTATDQTRPTDSAAAARAPGRADARRCGAARARAQPRHRRRAAESADLRLLDRGARRQLPADVQLQLRLRSQSHVPAQPDGRRRHRSTRDTMTGNTGITQNVKWGGGSFACRVQQQPAGAVGPVRDPQPGAQHQLQPPRYVQPLLRSFRIDGTRAQLRITQLNQEMSETALRGTIVRDARERAQRVLGPGLRDSGGRRRRALAGAGHEARRGQPGARRGRHAGAARRRAGAGRSRPTAARTVATTAAAVAHRGARAEAAHRQRHRRSVLDAPRIEPVDRPTFATESIDVEGAVRKALADTHRPSSSRGARCRPTTSRCAT